MSSGAMPSCPPTARSVISPAIRGEKRWPSPSARNRANPGSGRRGSRPAAGSGMASAAARRRICRSARSARVVRPGHAAAVGKQRATTDASRSMTSISAPPMYDATALIPIRASVLRNPASKAVISWPMVSAGVSVSAPRVPASSAASSMARRGSTAVAPTARTIAMAWTSRMSSALTARSVRPRRPAPVSAVWTAPTARIDGTGRRSSEAARSVRTTTALPRRDAPTASAAKRSSACSRPARRRRRPTSNRGR